MKRKQESRKISGLLGWGNRNLKVFCVIEGGHKLRSCLICSRPMALSARLNDSFCVSQEKLQFVGLFLF